MKNKRFYLEYASSQDKHKNKDTGNVVAVYTDSFSLWTGHYTAFMALESDPAPNTSALCHSEVSLEYLAHYCKRISEARAREIHSNLFVHLDQMNQEQEQ